jgi:hypothetical protein
MADNPGELADSMLGTYGGGAEDMTKKYAEKMKRAGDPQLHALWLRVCEIIRDRNKRPQ